MEIALLLLVMLLAANVWATRRVLQADEFTHRKVLLLMGIWLMPILGALAAKNHVQPRLPTEEPALPTVPPRSEGPLGREPAPRQLGGGASGSPMFDVSAHLASPNGLPVLDWQALQARAEAQGDVFAAQAAIEPVIAHEMTHSALANLRLPAWLDEGIAVHTEQ